jgi:GR25 family glycosyltransferase involved in LPS biosynthesis
VNNSTVDINTYFDKIFYVNLARDQDRNEYMLKQFKELSITNFERIEGVIYDTIPEKRLWRNFIKTDTRYILSSLGCRDSHLKAIKLAKDRGYKKILILEDDVYFTITPEELFRIGSWNLEWDMLYFSGLVEPYFRNQIVGAYAYGVNSILFDDILDMCIASGMEVDNFYAKIIQHMSYNYNPSGMYNIKTVEPFNTVQVNYNFKSNIR